MIMQALLAGTFALLIASTTLATPPEFAPVAAQRIQARAGLGNVAAKLQAGETVRVAYFGGSITAAPGWRVKSLAALRAKFPHATIEEINAAIGGTGSDLGVFRYEQDVLRHKPDLIFIEFAVNDGGAPPERIWRALDGVVRQAWTANPRTDICFVYTFAQGLKEDLAKGLCPRAASADEMLAAHYDIPSINVAHRISELRTAGQLRITPDDEITPAKGVEPVLFSNDGVHPLDAAHAIYAEVVAEGLDAALVLPAVDHRPQLDTPFVTDHWQAAQLVTLTAASLSDDWQQLDAEQPLSRQFHHRLGTLWEARKPGAKLTFHFRGSHALLYDLLGPDGGQVMITVDGQTRGPIPRFDRYCDYHRLATLPLASDLDPSAVHTVTVELHPDQPDRTIVLERVKSQPNFDPQKYDGTVLRVGAILVVGELVTAEE